MQIEVYPYEPGEDRIVLYAENIGRFVVNPDVPGWDHPLLEASIEQVGVPENLAIQATIYSRGSQRLLGGHLGCRNRGTDRGTRQADARAAPLATRSPLPRTRSRAICSSNSQASGPALLGLWWHQLHRDDEISLRVRLATQRPQRPGGGSWSAGWSDLPGKIHVSSHVHEKVIAELENEGPGTKRLQDLRVTAEKSRDAVYAGDLAALGAAMVENTGHRGDSIPTIQSGCADRDRHRQSLWRCGMEGQWRRQ